MQKMPLSKVYQPDHHGRHGETGYDPHRGHKIVIIMITAEAPALSSV